MEAQGTTILSPFSSLTRNAQMEDMTRDSPIVRLNVGGTVFCTTRFTLLGAAEKEKRNFFHGLWHVFSNSADAQTTLKACSVETCQARETRLVRFFVLLLRWGLSLCDQFRSILRRQVPTCAILRWLMRM